MELTTKAYLLLSSGNVTPSKNDLLLTKRLAEAGKLLGIDLLDHLIVGRNNYLSMREEKILH
nr:JAB domain-containing protein [Ligilactobacillus sp. Marseille-Q7487]